MPSDQIGFAGGWRRAGDEVKGRDLVSGIPTVRVHSAGSEAVGSHSADRGRGAARARNAPPGLGATSSRGIIMTGGAWSGLDILLAQETELPVHVDEIR
jgi:hypothetical protein